MLSEAQLAQDAGAIDESAIAVVRLEQLFAHDAFFDGDVAE
jgi:hypothetical protein